MCITVMYSRRPLGRARRRGECFESVSDRPNFEPGFLRAPWADFARTALKMTARVPSVQPAHALPTCRPWLGCATPEVPGPGRLGSDPDPGRELGKRKSAWAQKRQTKLWTHSFDP